MFPIYVVQTCRDLLFTAKARLYFRNPLFGGALRQPVLFFLATAWKHLNGIVVKGQGMQRFCWVVDIPTLAVFTSLGFPGIFAR